MNITDKLFYSGAVIFAVCLVAGPPGFDLLHVPTAFYMLIGSGWTMIAAAVVYVAQDICYVIREVHGFCKARKKDRNKN